MTAASYTIPWDTTRGHIAHGLTIAAVERDGDPHPLAVLSADFESIRAPAQIGPVHGDPTLVTALDPTRMPLGREAVRSAGEDAS
jgi:hypothetical protein